MLIGVESNENILRRDNNYAHQTVQSFANVCLIEIDN